VNRAGRELKGVAGGCRNPRQDVADTAVGERSRQLITAHSGFEAVDDLGAVICAQDMPGLALAPGFSLEAGGRLIVRVDLDAQPLADGQDLEQPPARLQQPPLGGGGRSPATPRRCLRAGTAPS
jgi:hypothetical protein